MIETQQKKTMKFVFRLLTDENMRLFNENERLKKVEIDVEISKKLEKELKILR